MKNSKTIKIRPAKIKDLPKIVEMCFKLGKYEEKIDGYFKIGKKYNKYFFDYFNASIYSKNKNLLVAEVGRKLIGFGSAQINKRPEYQMDRYGFIRDAYVDGIYRRKGVIGKILKVFYKWFIKNKIFNIELNVLVNNKIGKNAWNKYGFKDSFIGKRKILK